MIDIDKLERAALAANANGDVTLQIHPSAVLELINRLRTAEKDAKSWEDQADVLSTQDNKLIEEMTQQAIKAEEAITELEQKIAEQAAVIEKLRMALEYHRDVHCSNIAAYKLRDEALSIPTDSKQILAEWMDKQVIGLSDLLAEVNKADAALSEGRKTEALCAVRTAHVAASLIRCHVANRSLFKKPETSK